MSDDIREAVRERYAGFAKQIAVVPAGDACCGGAAPESGACCASGPADEAASCGSAYTAEQLAEVGLEGGVSLGCGNPTLLADLRPGQVVLDLGSGGGLDVLLSARRVGPDGRAYGVDMTDEMLDLAERNRERAGVPNATFLKGTIEQVPLPDASVDVVISNCVINLAADKRAVLREAARVLRPGGLFAVSDMVEVEALAPDLKREVDAWAGCVAGSIPVDEYRAHLVAAGFQDIDIDVHAEQELEGRGRIGSASIRARRA